MKTNNDGIIILRDFNRGDVVKWHNHSEAKIISYYQADNGYWLFLTQLRDRHFVAKHAYEMQLVKRANKFEQFLIKCHWFIIKKQFWSTEWK